MIDGYTGHMGIQDRLILLVDGISGVKERFPLDILFLVDLRQIAELTQHFIQVSLIYGITLYHDTVPMSMVTLID